MKTKQFIYKTMGAVMVAAAMLLGTSSAFAQVKIGTNPTTIDPANNLEVESSTAGNKVSVNKTTGKVTIADGSQGSGRVLVSDANGVATWQNKDITCSSFDAFRTGSQDVPLVDAGVGTYTTLIPDNEVYDAAGAFNTATGEYTVPESGFYTFKGSCGDYITGITIPTRNTTIAIHSAARGNLAFAVVQNQPYQSGSWNNITSSNYLVAGDIITFKVIVVHVFGTKPATTIPVYAVQFSGGRTDCNKN